MKLQLALMDIGIRKSFHIQGSQRRFMSAVQGSLPQRGCTQLFCLGLRWISVVTAYSTCLQLQPFFYCEFKPCLLVVLTSCPRSKAEHMTQARPIRLLLFPSLSDWFRGGYISQGGPMRAIRGTCAVPLGNLLFFC